MPPISALNPIHALQHAKAVLRGRGLFSLTAPALAAGLLALSASQAQAQNVLVLLAGRDADVEANIEREINNNGGTFTKITNMEAAGTLSAQTFDDNYYDIVISVQFAPAGTASSNQSVINAAIQNRKVGGAVLLTDAGDDATVQAVTNMRSILSAAVGTNITTTPYRWGRDENFVLNTNSPYSGSFASMNPMRGGWFFYMHGVPANNALYLNQGATPPAAGTTPVNNVAGVFVPSTQSFGGGGACVAAFSDSSMFETRNYRDRNITNGGQWNAIPIYNQNKFLPAVRAALSAGGACGIPASISKAFDKAVVARGESSELTIAVRNTSTADVPGLMVKDVLPTPLEVAGPATHTCTGGTLTTSGDTISLTGATLPAAGCAIKVPVRWKFADSTVCTATGTREAVNVIVPGPVNASKASGFTTDNGQTSDRASAKLVCNPALPPVPPPAPTPVPTLGHWSLMLLGLGAAGLGARRLRRKG